MALPIVLGATALRAGLSLLKSQGPKVVAKKYGKDGLKQIEKARTKELAKIDAKAGTGDPSKMTSALRQKSAETIKTKARDKRIDAERLEDALDIINEIKDEVPLKFSKGGLLTTDSSRIGYADGKLVNSEKADLDKDGKISSYEEARGKAIEESMREQKQEGGPMSMDDQMKMAMNMADESEMSPEQEMQPDEEMEDDYVDYVVSQSLDQEEEQFLMKELEGNPQLSMIFDKVMETASEFSGSGPIEGPGTEVSDSIPARLSDGEFVFTAKAVDVIGADNLMSLMKQAEAKADERLPAQEGGAIREEMQQQAGFAQPQETTQNIRVTKETVDPSAMVQEESDLTGDDIRSQMMLDPYQRHVRS